MLTFLNNLSLKKKLISMMVGLSLLLGIVAFALIQQLSQIREKDGLADFQSFAVDLGSKISAQFFERYGDVQAFAINKVLTGNNPVEITEALNSYIAIYQIYDLLIFVSPEGQLIASSNKAPNGDNLNTDHLKSINYTNLPWFKNSLEERFSNDEKKGFRGTFVEDAQIDPLTSPLYGKEMFGNSFSTIVKDAQGKVLGVLTARANFVWVEHEFVLQYKRLKELKLMTAELTLLNKKGEVLIDYDPTLNQGKEEIVRDFNKTIMKINLAGKGVESARKIMEKKVGADYSVHFRKNIEQISGYAFIDDPKFIDELGWGILVRTSVDDFLGVIHETDWKFFIIFGCCMLLTVALSLIFSHRLSLTLTNLTSLIAEGSQKVAQNSEKIALNSTELSESATEQGSALQETASCVDEIGAMAQKSAESALRSRELSSQNQLAAFQGKKTVEEMINAIDEISGSNAEIQNQMEQSNLQLANILKVISEIANKTKIINDIVFQTKLLSFNASVEAARAGEHGRGFSVVAEEVGHLAQLSGNAAVEISQILSESMKKVESIVSQTSTTVEHLVSTNKNKVEVGKNTAQKCGQALDEILQNVTTLNEMINEVSLASQEQSQGIQEVTKSMGQLDLVTQQNTISSQQSSQVAHELGQEADNLNSIVTNLFTLLTGKSNTSSKVWPNSGPTKGNFPGGPTSQQKRGNPPPPQSFIPKETMGGANKMERPLLRFQNNLKQENGLQARENQGPAASMPQGVVGNAIPSSEDPRFVDV